MFSNPQTYNASLENTQTEIQFAGRKQSANERLFALSKT